MRSHPRLVLKQLGIASACATLKTSINCCLKAHKGLPRYHLVARWQNALSCHQRRSDSWISLIRTILFWILCWTSSTDQLSFHRLLVSISTFTSRCTKVYPAITTFFSHSLIKHVTKDVVGDGYSLSSSFSAGSLLRHPLRTNCLFIDCSSVYQRLPQDAQRCTQLSLRLWSQSDRTCAYRRIANWIFLILVIHCWIPASPSSTD